MSLYIVRSATQSKRDYFPLADLSPQMDPGSWGWPMLNAGEEPETPSDPPTEVGYASLLSQKQENGARQVNEQPRLKPMFTCDASLWKTGSIRCARTSTQKY